MNNDNMGNGNGNFNNLVCYYCKKTGHVQRNCFKLQNDNQRGIMNSENMQGNASSLSPLDARRETAVHTRPPTPISTVPAARESRQ